MVEFTGENFPGGGMSKFLTCDGDSPNPSSRENPICIRVFQIVLRVGGNPSSGGGGDFSLADGNLRSDFDHLNLFQS